MSLVATAADQGGVPGSGYLDRLFRQSTATTNGRVVNRISQKDAEWRQEISARIKLRREELELTQRDLSILMDVVERTIAHWESGRPNYGALTQLAAVLRVPLKWLLTGDESHQERVERLRLHKQFLGRAAARARLEAAQEEGAGS